jgi:serine/threonine-protein kinase HipA
VYVHGRFAGVIEERDDVFAFTYAREYLDDPDAPPVSLTLPLRAEPYASKTFLPFFDGLLPEGWLLDVAVRHWKLDPRDRMGILLAVCEDCIGAVHVVADAPPERQDER